MYIEKKDLIGKVLYGIGFLFLISLLFSNLAHMVYFLDEYFTLGLIKLPLMRAIQITAIDVHPPLYYILLEFFVKIMSIFNLDIVYVTKIFSILPYLIILIVSGTKIKDEYNWLTAGLVAFTLFSMSQFIMYYLNIRMYSWSVLFFVLSFVYMKDVICNSDIKSWALFTLFTLLGAYTHYFNAISSVVLYGLLFLYFLLKDKKTIKKWLISCIALVIGYLPWTFILLNQLSRVHNNYWIPKVNFDYVIKCLIFYSGAQLNTLFSFFAIFFLIFVFVLVIYQHRKRGDVENYYILIGLSTFILTIILSTIISRTFKPILILRYLLPAIGAFWVATSILVGKIDDRYLKIISLLLILIMGIACMNIAMADYDKAYDDGIKKQGSLDKVNLNSSCVILDGDLEVIHFANYLTECDVYMNINNNDNLHLNQNDLNLLGVKATSNLNKTVDETDKQNVYLITRDLDSHNKNDSYDRINVYYFFKLK